MSELQDKTLQELFAETDEIGGKYQTPEEREGAAAKLAEAIADIDAIAESQKELGTLAESDALIAEAIEAIQAPEKRQTDEADSIQIQISESDNIKIYKLANTLGLSIRSILNSSIQYAIYQSGRYLFSRESREESQANKYKLYLNIDTLKKLDEAGIAPEDIERYAIGGMMLMYGKLIYPNS